MHLTYTVLPPLLVGIIKSEKMGFKVTLSKTGYRRWLHVAFLELIRLIGITFCFSLCG